MKRFWKGQEQIAGGMQNGTIPMEQDPEKLQRHLPFDPVIDLIPDAMVICL